MMIVTDTVFYTRGVYALILAKTGALPCSRHKRETVSKGGDGVLAAAMDAVIPQYIHLQATHFALNSYNVTRQIHVKKAEKRKIKFTALMLQTPIVAE